MDNITAQALKDLENRDLRVLTGTVYSGSYDASALQVTLDNNADPGTPSQPITVPSLVGPLPAGTRVTILVFPPSGMAIIGVIGLTFGVYPGFNDTSFIRRAYTTPLDTPIPWSKPVSPLFYGAIVTLQAGGGGSGGTAANTTGADRTSCSAGGQGGYFIKGFIRAENLTDTASVIVGSGGAAAAAGNNAGGDGGLSSFTDDSAVVYLSAPGGEGGAGGGISASGQTTQNGGDAVQTATVDSRVVTLDFQNGDDGGTGFRYLAGTATGVIWPGFGGGSRMAGQTRIGGISSDQIAPSSGYAFGGGASGRGVRVAGNFSAGGGAAGAQGLVLIEELYRI